jgi:hypothetical protein
VEDIPAAIFAFRIEVIKGLLTIADMDDVFDQFFSLRILIMRKASFGSSSTMRM